ncbi:MAG: tyrosine-protein phosphatase [Mycobacteriales bacterium]
MDERELAWAGCYNVRDLGGLPTAGGRTTVPGAVVRADSLDTLTAAGWQALYDHGVRTVVDLRDPDEVAARDGTAPDGIVTVAVPLDDSADTAMWRYFRGQGLDGSPLYYRPFLERKPERCAAAVAAVARAAPGGVVVHCGLGRDRTGLVTMLLLALAGVTPEAIADDYALSADRLPARWSARGEQDQNAEVAELLRRAGTTARAALLATLDWLEPASYLRSAGLADTDLTAVRARLLDA